MPEILVIREDKKGLWQIILFLSFTSLVWVYPLVYFKEIAEKIIMSVFLVLNIIILIWFVIDLIINKPKVIFSQEGIWHRDLKEKIKWIDISSFRYQLEGNDGITNMSLVLKLKNNKKELFLDFNFISFSIYDINEFVNSYSNPNQLHYNGIVSI